VSSHQSTIPHAAYQYFKRIGVDMWEHGQRNHPVITQVYGPGRTGDNWRWCRYPIRKRVSESAIRRLHVEGVTHVQLAAGGHCPDFTVTELLRSAARARRASRQGNPA
jgi:hypothetical protein